MKGCVRCLNQLCNFLRTEYPGKMTQLLRIGGLRDAPVALQHVNAEETQRRQPQDDGVRTELQLGEQHRLVLANVLRAKLIGRTRKYRLKCSTPCRYVRMVVAAKLRRCNSSSMS